jgi:hypothetical protein
MTTIYIYDPKAAAPLPPLPVSALVIATWNLLEEASDLPQPSYITVHHRTQSIGLQFPAEASSYRAIARWAHRFGAVITTAPVGDDGDGLRTSCSAEFDYYGIRAQAYAIIPAAPPAA